MSKMEIFVLDKNNITKKELNIIKPKTYTELLKSLSQKVPNIEYYEIFIFDQNNNIVAINNAEKYQTIEDILFIREIDKDILEQSLFQMNYDKLSESKKDILDEKYNCLLCAIIIKKEKPYFCYKCQKIFHEKCLKDWDNKCKLQNKVLICPNCRNELPLEKWNKKLDYEDNRKDNANLLNKINEYKLNNNMNDNINRIKEKQINKLKDNKIKQSQQIKKYENFTNKTIEAFKIILNNIKLILSSLKLENNIELNNVIENYPKNYENLNIDYVSNIINEELLNINNFIRKNIYGNKNEINNNNANNNKIIKKPDLSKFKLIETKRNLNIYLYPSINFTDNEAFEALTFMTIGEKDCGIKTLINGFINFSLAVKIGDNYRFKIINENQDFAKINNKINVYNIKSIGGYPPLRIIDIPEFENLENKENNMKIFDNIKEYILNKIGGLNAICFVIKSTNAKFSQRQIFNIQSILDLFGEEFKDSFIFFITLSSDEKHTIIESLKDIDSPFFEIIQSYKDSNWYYESNNSVIFGEDRESQLSQSYWNLGENNFSDFKLKLKSLPIKSLDSTKNIISKRQDLVNKVRILSNKLELEINAFTKIKDIIKEISNLKNDINDCKNYKKTIKQPSIRKINVEPNHYALTCLQCTKTCDPYCEMLDDDEKYKCAAIGRNGHCKICPKKCHWQEHKLRDYILEETFEERTIILEELKKRYDCSKNHLSIKLKLLSTKKEELIKLNIECQEIQRDISEIIVFIKRNALNKSISGHFEQLIDLIISLERLEKEKGWNERINYYKNMNEIQRIPLENFQEIMNNIKTILAKEMNKYIDYNVENSRK